MITITSTISHNTSYLFPHSFSVFIHFTFDHSSFSSSGNDYYDCYCLLLFLRLLFLLLLFTITIMTIIKTMEVIIK